MNNDATNPPIFLKNEATPDSTVFASANPASTDASAGTGYAPNIFPDAHIPPSGQKQYTKPFYPVNAKNMDKKNTIDTTPEPDAHTDAFPHDNMTWQSPTPHIHWEIAILPPAPLVSQNPQKHKKVNDD